MTDKKLIEILLEAPWIKGSVGYVIFIAAWLFFFPDKTGFATQLANHLPYFIIYGIGLNFMELFEFIVKRKRHISLESET